jgi:hypothetical protein
MVLGFEDWEFWLRMGQLGRTGKVMQTPNYLRRRHERSMLDRAERIRPQLIEEMKSYNERLFRDAAWLEAVRASAARDDPFRFPDRLAAMRRALTPDTNQGMLCILPGLASDTAGQASLALMSSLGDRFTFTLLTCEAQQHPDRAAFASHTNDIFHLPASGIAGGFGPFIRYLVATRRIGTVVLSGAHAVADAIPEVRQLCPDVTVVELVPDAEPGEASAMRSTANGTIDHFVCLSAAGRDRLRSSGVGADRIAVPEPGAEAMADAIAQACGRRTADNA